MSFLKLKKFGVLAAGAGLLAVLAMQGCSSDETQAAPSAGAGGKANAGAAGKLTGGESAKAGNGGSAGTPDEEPNAGAGNVDGEGGAAGEPAVDPGCIGDDGCYSCAPKTNNQFLNACVEGGCPATFDNSTLSKLNLVGTL
ncbi:MAG TPA: hypothetical protein VFK05_01045 [Polyangiaceae bacterium]|nr:hypothetical protein [Polyangiaceae bacterium]